MSGDHGKARSDSPAATGFDAGAWESPGEVARIASASAELVRRYVKDGLISCLVDGSGRRSFPPGTGLRVRALKAERMGVRQSSNAS